jgi:hypothetical protein
MIRLAALRRLLPAIREHRKVEEETARLLRQTLDERYIGPPPKRARLLQYAQRHAFSILFLAIYRALGIPAERRLFYGVINHAIRGIVTGADNLLDDECKEMLPLAFAPAACRFKSVMHILLFDRFLFRVVDEAAARGWIGWDEREGLQRQIFAAMVPIGEEEATEEGGIGEVLPPAAILESIHSRKGGDLLRLAFVAPRLVERPLARPLELADRGIYRIGLALQVIDDLTDFYPDLRDRRHNYLASSVRHEGTAAERAALAEALAAPGGSGPPLEGLYADSLRRVVHRAVGEALEGFALLEEAGFWLRRRQALALLRTLFRLRGVGHLLAFWPPRDAFTLTLEGADGR